MNVPDCGHAASQPPDVLSTPLYDALPVCETQMQHPCVHSGIEFDALVSKYSDDAQSALLVADLQKTGLF